MKTRTLVTTAALLLALGGAALGHDPRDVNRTMTTQLELEEIGSFELRYKPHHYNAVNFERAKANERFLSFLNQAVWGELGTADVGFDVAFGDQALPKGRLTFGINMTTEDEFFAVFRAKEGHETQQEWKIALERFEASPAIDYLTVSIIPTADPERFELTARCGPYSGRTHFAVAAMREHSHAHDAEHAHEEHAHDDEPAREEVAGADEPSESPSLADLREANSLNDQAWGMLTGDDQEEVDIEKALALAKKADALSAHRNSAILDTLALAYLRAGDAKQALATQKKAVEHFDAWIASLGPNVDSAQAKALREEITGRLAEYEEKIGKSGG